LLVESLLQMVKYCSHLAMLAKHGMKLFFLRELE